MKFIHDQCPALSIKEKFDFVLARLAIYCSRTGMMSLHGLMNYWKTNQESE